MFNLFKLFNFGGMSRSTVSRETEAKIQRDWENIEVLLKQKGPSQLRQALITADKCMDNALRDISKGETMGERLISSESRFDSITYNKIWEAHKLRNNLVHESGFEPPYFVLIEGVEKLKKGLTALGVKI